MGGLGSLFGGPTGQSVQNPISQQEGTNTNNDLTNAFQQQQSLLNALQAQGGLANQSNVFGQQQALSNQLGQIGQGQGPNPALAQLQQATGQNVAGQASLAASQRGAASNVGLMQRQAAQQGAGIQQQAVGQGATLQAQQQLAALQQQAAQQQSMQGVAASQIGAQQGATNAYQQGALQQQGNVYGAQASYNQAANANQQNQQNMFGSIASGLGSAAASPLGQAAFAALAHGGQIPQGYDDGGIVSDQEVARAQLLNGISGTKTPNSYKGQNFSNTQYTPEQIAAQQASPYYVPDSTQATNQPKSQAGRIISGMAKGGKVKNLVSGGHVAGQAKVPGDSYKNDTVKARLSPGEIVLPRSVAQHPDAPEMAKRFVQAIHAKKGILRK